MVDTDLLRIWIYRSIFVAVVLLIMGLSLLPVSTLPGRVPGPDLLVALTAAWVVRRPEYVPVTIVAALGLLSDLLFLRPPGLWAVGVVVLTEFLRANVTRVRDLRFTFEWALFAIGFLGLILGYRVALTLGLTDPPPLGGHLLQYVITIVCYPLVVLVTVVIFGVHKLAPGETDRFGHPI